MMLIQSKEGNSFQPVHWKKKNYSLTSHYNLCVFISIAPFAFVGQLRLFDFHQKLNMFLSSEREMVKCVMKNKTKKDPRQS